MFVNLLDVCEYDCEGLKEIKRRKTKLFVNSLAPTHYMDSVLLKYVWAKGLQLENVVKFGGDINSFNVLASKI